MWRKLSLRGRINSLIGVMLALGLAANVARLVLEAGPRVQAEDRSVIRLARELIGGIAPGIGAGSDASAQLDRIVSDLNRSRHVSVARRSGADIGAAPDGGDRPADATRIPSWFTALIHPERISVSVPLTIAGRQEALVVTSHPDDEIREIWDGIVTQLSLGIVVAVVLFVVNSLVIRRALGPLDTLSRVLMDIEAGQYRARVVPSGAPELAALCARVNHLAMTLDDALEDRRKLAERIVSLQDLERRDIARDLHDEFGPHLFALRAHAGAVMRLAERDPSMTGYLSTHGTAILAQIDALQQFNRRVLERLRPAGLADLGLPGAIDVLIRLWRESNPQVVIDSDISPALGRLGDAAELTAYRVVQEGLTNSFRHAQATRIVVTIDRAAGAGQGRGRPTVVVRISDDGRGIASERQPGFGLVGMRERVWAVGGMLTVTSTSDGVVIEARFPAEARGLETAIPADREFVPVRSGE